MRVIRSISMRCWGSVRENCKRKAVDWHAEYENAVERHAATVDRVLVTLNALRETWKREEALQSRKK